MHKSGQPLRIPDAYDHPRFNQAVDRRTGYRTRAVLAVPLLAPDGSVLGVLQLLNKADGQGDWTGQFSEEEEASMGAFSEYLAAAVGCVQSSAASSAHQEDSKAKHLQVLLQATALLPGWGGCLCGC